MHFELCLDVFKVHSQQPRRAFKSKNFHGKQGRIKVLLEVMGPINYSFIYSAAAFYLRFTSEAFALRCSK